MAGSTTHHVDADVIVIGAGAAGLAAACTLAGQSLQTIVVEARDRIGGRVWTVPTAGTAVPAELGAEFIHGLAPETTALLRKAGTAAIETGGEPWTRDDDCELRHMDTDFMSSASILERARTLAADESVDRYLQRFSDDATMRETVEAARAFVEGFEAADPALASVQAIAAELRSGVDGSAARPIGGYRPMFEYLHESCIAAGARVFLSTVVRTISWRRGAVAVDVMTGQGGARTLRGRAAVVTLPVGVLRYVGNDSKLAFEPGLPVPKREALAAMEMGHVVKVALRFRTAFWERLRKRRYRDAAFFRCPGDPFPTYWTQFPVRSELIAAWVGGPKARLLASAGKEEIVERALDGFGALFGEIALARDEFESGIVHDWGSDPFARGAYSYVTVGGTNARAALATPVDETLFIAGEATSTDGQGGTVNGALETGVRAAREVVDSLEGTLHG